MMREDDIGVRRRLRTWKPTFAYARISARAVRKALVKEKGYEEASLPTRQTIGTILNRMGYRLKKHKKPNP
jgi:predicted site-specific integrase-resolvase